MKRIIEKGINWILWRSPFKHTYAYFVELHLYYANANRSVSQFDFFRQHLKQFYMQPQKDSKAKQIQSLLDKVDLLPVDNKTFYYSLDCFKTLKLQNPVFDNYSVDYTKIVHSSLGDLAQTLKSQEDAFGAELLCVIDAMEHYLQRMKADSRVCSEYAVQIEQIESLFHRPAATFREALQRILFFNQFLWQTRHKHNGFGHLDWMLIDLYRQDIANGILTKDQAKSLLLDFFHVLHANCWFKSTMLLGDTGQIIILGGLRQPGQYCCNELTYLFIEASMAAKLPDPKVLLRCSVQMPDDLLKLALECISTGIGAPFLSNDDAVIPRLIEFGYCQEDACNYATAACWEPLILDTSFDQNNVHTLNFAQPLNRMLDTEDMDRFDNLEAVTCCYKRYLAAYIRQELTPLTTREFEEAPFFSLLSSSAMQARKDITRGGAVYSNLGLTTVGMATVVNSLLNISKYVFEEKRFTLTELNTMRKANFLDQADTVQLLKENLLHYGSDDAVVLALTNQLTGFTCQEFDRYRTKYGGKFKFGLSAPGYVTLGSQTAATLDGRRDAEPFMVHISASGAVPATELISFACQLDYSGNRLNGNVVDMIVSPDFLRNNLEKFMLLLKAGFANGLYQMQLNVVDSATIIAARKNPELFPDLIVRVWGFSAYFKDLPTEYQDMLVERALQSEAAQRG